MSSLTPHPRLSVLQTAVCEPAPWRRTQDSTACLLLWGTRPSDSSAEHTHTPDEDWAGVLGWQGGVRARHSGV